MSAFQRTALVAGMAQLASPTAVAYGESPAIKLTGGDIFHIIEIDTNLKNKKTMRRATLDIGGQPIVSPSGEVLDLLDKFYTRHTKEGRLVIDLSKFDYRSAVGVFQTALATSVFDAVTLTIELGQRDTSDEDPANHDPVTPTIRAKAYRSDNPLAGTVGGGRQFVPFMDEFTQHSPSAGAHKWEYPNGKASIFVQRMILKENEVGIAKITIKRGKKVLREIYREDNDFGLQRYAGVTLQDGYLLLDFTQFGFGTNDSLATNGLNFEFEADSNGAIKTFVEGYEQVA